MATREIVVWTCDVCGTEDLVDTHIVTVDGHSVEGEACDKCWQAAIAGFAKFANAGRVPELTKVSAKKQVMAFPGESWKFTAHALKRMGERHISPVDAARAADDPEIVTPGLNGSGEVRIKGKVKVIVKPEGRLIITAAKRDEEIDRVA